jgi:hypothetical protein
VLSRGRAASVDCRDLRLLRKASTVKTSDPASIAPSRSIVFQEIGSFELKQPQLISFPWIAAWTISEKNTISRADVIALETRSHTPAMSATPRSSSNAGRVRARNSTGPGGSSSYESIDMAKSCHGNRSFTQAA